MPRTLEYEDKETIERITAEREKNDKLYSAKTPKWIGYDTKAYNKLQRKIHNLAKGLLVLGVAGLIQAIIFFAYVITH